MTEHTTDERMFERRVHEAAKAATALPAPPDAWARIAARVQDGDAVVLPALPPRPGVSHPVLRGLRVAGVALLLAGAATAAVLPIAPVRLWLGELFRGEGVPAVVADPSLAPPAETEPETTLFVEPVNDAVVVALETPATGVSIRVVMADRRELEVRATGAAAGAQFRSAAGRLTVVQPSGGALVVTIPRTLARVRLEIDGRAYLTRENGQLRVLAPAADTAGAEIVLHITR